MHLGDGHVIESLNESKGVQEGEHGEQQPQGDPLGCTPPQPHLQTTSSARNEALPRVSS